MILYNSEIKYRDHTSIISYKINCIEFKRMILDEVFNFNPFTFKNPIPEKFKEAKVHIIADKKHSLNYNSKKFLVDHSKWHYYYIDFDGVKNPTFISMRIDGLLKGSIVDSLIEFAFNNHVFKSLPKDQNFGIIMRKFKTIFNAKEINEKSIELDLNLLIKELFESTLVESLKEIVSSFLDKKNIDYYVNDQLFFSEIEVDGNQWEFNLSVKDHGQLLVISTSMNLKEADPIDVLKDIDFINQEVKTGLFYIDFKNKNIVYENKFLINIPILNQQLEETFLPHLNNMRAFTLALKERYNLNQICK